MNRVPSYEDYVDISYEYGVVEDYSLITDKEVRSPDRVLDIVIILDPLKHRFISRYE
jgi:hypothetical protein